VTLRLPNGGPVLDEPARGYQAGPENGVVPDLVAGRRATRVLDLGAGCGSLGLLASAGLSAPPERTVLLERQTALAEYARTNGTRVAWPVDVVLDDLRTWQPEERFDLILTNPPWFMPGEGQLSSNETTRNATHGFFGGVPEFAEAAARLLAAEGRCWMVVPADRLVVALQALDDVGLQLRQLVICHARHAQKPWRVWIESAHTPGPVAITQCSVWTRR
jgi:tRNA1(Val) A37 N6-methylase TrmN6